MRPEPRETRARDPRARASIARELRSFDERLETVAGGNSRGETIVHLHPKHLHVDYSPRAKYPNLAVGEEGAFARWFLTHEIADDAGLFVTRARVFLAPPRAPACTPRVS